MTSADLETKFEAARQEYRKYLVDCYWDTPEWHGKMMRPRKGGAHSNRIAMTFSVSLIDFAEGMPNLREHWEIGEP